MEKPRTGGAIKTGLVVVPALALLVALGVLEGGAAGSSGQGSARAQAKPNAPRGLRIASVTEGRPTLAWSAGTTRERPIRYLVYRNHGYVAATTSAAFTFAVVPCGSAPTLGVRIVDARGNRSPESAAVFRRTCPGSVPGAPAQAPAPQPPPPSAPAPEPVAAAPSAPQAAAPATAPGLSSGSVSTPPPTPPPAQKPVAAPAPCGPPIRITKGGSYSGCWVSTSSVPAVRIATREPVEIVDSTVVNLGGGDLIVTHPKAPAEVTLDRVTGRGGTGLFFQSSGFKSITIRNCTIDKTGGIYLSLPTADASIVVTRTKQRNVQYDPRGYVRHFLQFHDVTSAAAVDVSWNEVVNVFGRSSVDDVISIYDSAHVSVHDNYIQGAYPTTSGSAYSGSGIMIEEHSYDNEIFDNQVIDTTNAGIGIAGGRDNSVYRNKVLSDGTLDDGTPLAASNVGIYVWNSNSTPEWANNHAIGNTVGWLRFDGTRNNLWFPNAPGSDYALNTALADNRLITRALEQAEWLAWLAKLAASGVRVGA